MVASGMDKNLSQACAGRLAARELCVLLVDDSALARAALAGLLQFYLHIGMAAEAGNGTQALELAARLQPDVVITDLHVQDCDGLKLIEIFRQRFPSTRSVLTSAHEAPTLKATSLQHGADAYIPKHLLSSELPHLLTRMFPEAAKLTISKAIE